MTNPADNTNPMALWRQVEKSDPASLKEVEIGRRVYTDINSVYQVQRATELWGPYGKSWGIRNLKWGEAGRSKVTYKGKDGEAIEDEQPLDVTLDAEFFYPPPPGVPGAPAGLEPVVFQISVCLGYNRNGDTRKKLQTMALSKAFQRLGFNADVFRGEHDRNRKPQGPRQPKPQAPRSHPPQGPGPDPLPPAAGAPLNKPAGSGNQDAPAMPWLKATGLPRYATQAQLDLMGREFNRINMHGQQDQETYVLDVTGAAEQRRIQDLSISEASTVIRKLKADTGA